jgi:hypothetical protein
MREAASVLHGGNLCCGHPLGGAKLDPDAPPLAISGREWDHSGFGKETTEKHSAARAEYDAGGAG